jgi:DNA-directed RNA polymerase specialized sigma24 family protein
MTMEFNNTAPEQAPEKTLEALYRKYSGVLHRFLVRFNVQRDDVPDIVQETLLSGAQSRGAGTH